MNTTTSALALATKDVGAPIGPAGRVVPTDPAAALMPIEAADLLGTSARTLEAWRSRGEGPPYVKVGAKAVRYPRGQLLDWLGRRTMTA